MFSNASDSYLCRISRYGKLIEKEFRLISCAQCYHYLPHVITGFKAHFNITDDFLFEHNGQLLNPYLDTKKISKMMSSLEYEKWHECCEKANHCCDSMIDNKIYPSNRLDDNVGYCGSIWDGWACHQTTKSGKSSLVRCPNHHVEDTCHTILGTFSFSLQMNI